MSALILRGTLPCALLLLAACAPYHHQPVEAPVPVREPVHEPEPPPVEWLDPVLEEELEPAPATAVLLDPLEGIDWHGFEMPVHLNSEVMRYIDFFTGRARPRFEQWLQRQGRYEALIMTELRARGLPAELLYLPLIESGYSPVAVSHANAVGLWQFIASTGRLEGLEISHYLDERRDPVRATEAALQHLEKLHRRFGSWYLAAAAYNAGPGRIERALTAGVNGQRGEESIYWLIRDLLPTETRNYVPQLLAATIIGTHRELFGFGHVVPEPPLTFEMAHVPDATELAVIAEVTGINARDLAALNTHFHRGITPPGPTLLRVPVGYAEGFAEAYAMIPADQRVRTFTHVVARGETLSGIAARYGTSVAAIQSANRIARADRISVGMRLIVPRSGTAGPALAAGAAPTVTRAAQTNATTTARVTQPAAATYTVRRGDTLIGIARSHGIALSQLLSMNGLSASSVIQPGQTLRVRTVTVYRVQPGDTLAGIARRHGVSLGQLMEWNALQSHLIHPGDQLEVRN